MEWNVGGLGEVGDGKKIMRKLNFVPRQLPYPPHPHAFLPDSYHDYHALVGFYIFVNGLCLPVCVCGGGVENMEYWCL